MIRRVVAIVMAAALAAAACGDDAAGPPPLVTSTTSTTSTLERGVEAAPEPPLSSVTGSEGSTIPALPTVEIEQVDCPATLRRSDGLALSCGALTVPIDRNDALAGTTRISLATLAGDDPGMATPVAVLQGGPGGASSELGTWFPRRAFTQVFVDQRGTGFIGPDFDCPEIELAFSSIFAVGSAAGDVLAEEAYDECARRLSGDALFPHIDSEAHAADVVDAMTALGYGSWALYGVSYGTTIGLELLRDAPAGLVGVVLDGLYPPELDTEAALAFSATRAIDVLDAGCVSNAGCRSYLADGSVRTTMERVMADLDDDPMVVSRIGDDLGFDEPFDVVLDGRRVAEFSFLLMYHESLLRYLPAVLGALDGRDTTAGRWLARTGARLMVASAEANNEGTFFAVQCHERLPFTDGPGEDIDAFAAANVAVPLAAWCDGWNRSGAGEEADDPVGSAVPALLLSGEFDPIVPHEFAEDVAARLEAATTVEQGGRGHGIWYGNDCIGRIVEQFVVDPTATLDTACADTPVPVEWARP